jgi:hypothetical protein
MFNRRQFKKGPRKKPKYHPYRSALEKRIAQKIHKSFSYEPKGSKVDYIIPHKYNPDFVHPDALNILIEVKGYFRDSKEAKKYVHIKKDNPDKELVFIFYNVDKKCHGNCRPRTDGSVLTIREWLTKHQFLWYLEKELPEEIINGTINDEWIAQQREEFGYE